MYKIIKGNITAFEKQINETECMINAFAITPDASIFAAIVTIVEPIKPKVDAIAELNQIAQKKQEEAEAEREAREAATREAEKKAIEEKIAKLRAKQNTIR